jgi:hypothetical protein
MIYIGDYKDLVNQEIMMESLYYRAQSPQIHSEYKLLDIGPKKMKE